MIKCLENPGIYCNRILRQYIIINMKTLYTKVTEFFNHSFIKASAFVLCLVASSASLASGYEPTMIASEIVSAFDYNCPEPDRSNVFADHSVLVLVPHEDDEACLLGGVFEEYVRAGSIVSVAFSTNGDYDSDKDTPVRAAESIAALETCGIDPKNVYFLGYGDQWQNEHIYNARDDKKLTSHAGRTETYGSDALHKIFHEGNDYTRNNYKSDICSLINTLRPDTIFCIDFDGHKDHRCLSLLFEEVMGEMLHDDPSYTPVVLKSFGYSIAWHAVQDFYQINILSCRNPYDTSFMQENYYYDWADRIRFPVARDSIGRLKTSSTLYKMLACYPTQNAAGQAGGIINGDRVFWHRDTSSLLYAAKVSATSGNASLLTDFKIIDTEDISKVEQTFKGNVWTPSASDKEKTITVHFAEPTDLTELRFYDNTDLTSNILNLTITFSDESSVESGALKPNGAPTSVSFEAKHAITWFTVTLNDCVGKNAGLCEIEAYNGTHNNDIALIKMINESEDFVYDYWIDEEGEETFSIYAYPSNEVNDLSALYSLEYDEGDTYSAYFEGNKIRIACEPGSSFDLTVRSISDPLVYDTVKISNPSQARRLLLKLLQHFEHASGI